MNSDLRQPGTQTGYEQIQQGGKEAEAGAKLAARSPEGRQEGQEDEEKGGAGKERKKEKAGERKEGAGPGGLGARGWVATAARRCRRCP